MKVRNLVLIGIIVAAIIIAVTVVITKNIYSSPGSEDYYDSEDEVEMITVSVCNKTGKTINILYTYQENNEKYKNNGEPIWIDTLGDQPLEVNETRNIQLESLFFDDLWDFMIVTEDDQTYELKEILSTDYVYDGAVLEFIIVDDYLDIFEESVASVDDESDEELVYEENTEEQEELYVDAVENEEQVEYLDEEEVTEENVEDDDEEDEVNEEELYLEDFE